MYTQNRKDKNTRETNDCRVRTAEVVLGLLQERRILEPPLDAAPAERLELGDGRVAPLRVAEDGRSRGRPRRPRREVGPGDLQREGRTRMERRRSESNRSEHLSLPIPPLRLGEAELYASKRKDKAHFY